MTSQLAFGISNGQHEPGRESDGPSTLEATAREKIEYHVGAILTLLGQDSSDQHFLRTPTRFAGWLEGFRAPSHAIDELLTVQFDSAHEELVAVTGVPFVSLCAHHLLPFEGRATIGYVPKGKIIGLSKLVRALHYHAHRATVQEDVTHALADDLERILAPLGVMVVLESVHSCMSLRGVKAGQAVTVTSAVRGCFLDNLRGSKDELLALRARG